MEIPAVGRPMKAQTLASVKMEVADQALQEGGTLISDNNCYVPKKKELLLKDGLIFFLLK